MTFLILLLLGLCFGSFVNALVWRLHQQASQKHPTKKQKQDLSILRGRSMCVHCHHTLAWYDLLPVVSWVSLRGTCRYCKKPISWQYPVVETLTAASFVGSYLVWPYGWEAAGVLLFAVWLVFLVGFMALAVYDLKWMELPNKIVYPLIGLAVIQVGLKAAVYQNPSSAAMDALVGFITIGGLFYALFQVSGGRWIGGGDVKLAFMIGPLVGGPVNSLLVIFLASCLGSLVSLPLIARKSLRATSRIPFGPFLLVATVVAYTYGERIADWYMNIFL
jgi:prepilin signal peptidase PulO-like enzyme (type II secretory pathway)